MFTVNEMLAARTRERIAETLRALDATQNPKARQWARAEVRRLQALLRNFTD